MRAYLWKSADKTKQNKQSKTEMYHERQYKTRQDKDFQRRFLGRAFWLGNKAHLHQTLRLPVLDSTVITS
jgi:hypothetical protein